MRAQLPLHIIAARVAGIGAVLLLLGCQNPLARTEEEELREQMLGTHILYMRAITAGPPIEITRAPSEVEQQLTEERRRDLDKRSGPTAYTGMEYKVGADLMGDAKAQWVGMSIQRAVELAAQNNLQVALARLVPAFNETQVTQAEAAFDAVYYFTLNYTGLDTPRPPSTLSPPSGGELLNDTTDFKTGIRKPLQTGGEVAIETEFTRNHFNPTFFDTDPYYNSDVLLTLKQPLLRKFGTDVNRADIQLAQSARRQAVEDLRKNLLQTVNDTEAAYWKLVLARQALLIRQHLLDLTVEDHDKLEKRAKFDVNPVRLTEANSFVELRRADVIRARQDVRLASDALKLLINSPDLPVTGEIMIQPLEIPADVPISISLLDAVTTALRRRPELQKALAQIKDASIRQRVADNARLPMLDLSLGVRLNGENSRLDGTYGKLTEGNFIDYLIGLQFEAPIGNRAAEGLWNQRKIERRGAVLSYQGTAQGIVVEVKNAMRNLMTDYELIGAARAARRAASDSLRAIQAQEDAGAPLTPEFLLDLKLATQGRVADAETQEYQALTDYSTAIAAFYRAMGTLLERNHIDFKDEPAAEFPTGAEEPFGPRGMGEAHK